MTTARIAFEALQASIDEQRDTAEAELDAAAVGSEDAYIAIGTYSAYKAISAMFAKISAEGFEPDELDIATVKTELMTQIADTERRALRLRQNVANARDKYEEFWMFMRSIAPGRMISLSLGTTPYLARSS